MGRPINAEMRRCGEAGDMDVLEKTSGNVILRGNKKVRKCISVWTLVSRARDGDSLEWRMSEKEMNGGGLGDSRASLRSRQAAIRAMAGTSTDANNPISDGYLSAPSTSIA